MTAPLTLLCALLPAVGEGPAPGSDGSPTWSKVVTASASTNGARVPSLELGYVPTADVVVRWHLETEEGYTRLASLTFEYGLTGAIDVSATITGGTAYEAHWDLDGDGTGAPAWGAGLGDTALGAEWAFARARDGALAAIGQVLAPTGVSPGPDRVGLTQGCWSVAGAIVGSATWGRWTANGEAGYDLPVGGDRGDRRGAAFANVAGGWQPLPWLQPEIELSYGHAVIAGAPDRDVVGVTLGVVAPLGAWSLAAGVQASVFTRNTSSFVDFTGSATWTM